MTVPTAENPYPAPEPEGPPAPFQSAVQVPLDRIVNLAQLTDEIAAATKRVVHLAVGTDAEGVSTLSVSPGGVNASLVADVVAKHEPQSDYGVSPIEKRFTELLALVTEEDDPVMTPVDIQAAVVGLLRRAAQPGPRDVIM